MKAHSGIQLTAAEVDYVQGGLAHLSDSMEKYTQWIKTKGGRPLPGMEEAIKEIYKDVADIQKLSMRVFNECFAPTY
jgi:hypothetical protein